MRLRLFLSSIMHNLDCMLSGLPADLSRQFSHRQNNNERFNMNDTLENWFCQVFTSKGIFRRESASSLSGELIKLTDNDVRHTSKQKQRQGTQAPYPSQAKQNSGSIAFTPQSTHQRSRPYSAAHTPTPCWDMTHQSFWTPRG